MKKWRNWLLVTVLLSAPAVSHGDPGNNYCITPAFISASIKPNLLLMIDNSASMYDLAFVDRGKKHCSTTTAQACFYDTDCPSGESCSAFDRQPYYCYDETYSNANTYTGTFDKDTYYYYRSASDDFAVLANFSNGCPGATGDTVKSIANTMCVQYTTASGTLTKFAAKGNYLNWLTASKMDVEKNILTGGKWDGTGIQSESRGCVGQGYVKQALTSDFVNFSGSADNDDNVSLQVTFTITGPGNPYSPTAPSSGGTSFINLYAGKTYHYADCQQAVNDLATGGNADIKQSVSNCLSSSSPTTGYCQQRTTQSCTTSSDCSFSSSTATYVCTGSPLTACNGTTDATTCQVAARSACSLDSTRTCTTDSNCQVTVSTPEKLGTCGTWSPALPNGAHPPTSCSPSSPCSYVKSHVTYTAPCNGYSAASTSTTNYGTCVSTPASNFGPCVANYTGPCVLPAGAAITKTKVSFQQSMQACWSLRNGHAIGNDDINTVKNQCSDVFGSYATCSNNHSQTCSRDSDCGTGNSCQTGPLAIAPGSPALLCGSSYEGQFYTQNGSGAWVLSSSATTQQMIDVHTQFCNDMNTPKVTDPSDAPSDTTVADNLPAIISGVGVEAQLGQPVGKMRVKLATNTEPTGIVQQFGNQIRIGAMAFNQAGSASETALAGVSTPKVCSNNSAVSCTQNSDCGTGTCQATGNLDGGRILYPIGKGVCATMSGAICSAAADCASGESCLNGYCGTLSSTVCTTVKNCSGSSQACISSGVGSHTTAGDLVGTIDAVKANTWTPFSEAFYNAIGYFAQVPSGADAGKSRTALRLNGVNTTSTDFSSAATAPIDFNEALNPSEYRCQQNYVLLISDGSSTADRNSSVNALATLYAPQAGITQTSCTGASSGSTADYGGNNNLPILTWLAKNRRISDFSLSGSASTTPPSSARDSMTTYVVFNGESNGAAGDCNSLTLLTKAATKGGTTLKQASDPASLRSALTSVFQEVAAKSASGTAASILSNSEGSGANILQAVFYPKKIFDNNTAVNWIGEMQNLWYFVDPNINNSTIREDSDSNDKLNLVSDKVVHFTFDNTSNKTMVQLLQDNSNGTGADYTPVGGLIDPDAVKSLWRAGKLLWSRDLTTSPRTLYTPLISGGTEAGSGTGLMKLSWSSPDNSTVLAPYLQAADAGAAQKIMKYVHGFDFPGDSTMRSRTVQIGNIPSANVTDAAFTSNPRDKGIGVWKLGDIISSTPRVQSTVRLGTYNLSPPGGYSDYSYLNYITSSAYQSRGMVYVGANDGMLHAFKLGLLSVRSSGNDKASLSGTNLGQESWAFVPKNVLPYLKYLQDPNYQHLYSVDGRVVLADVSIGDNNTDTCVPSTYWTCSKPTTGSSPTNTWRTVLIGGMGLGGASAKSSTTNFVTTPINDPADASKGLGYSSYFALDVTDPNNPQLLWEFTHPALGYSTSGPAIVRVGSSQKNGRWFAIFGSGPTGPIDTTTHQFQGRSSQELKFFVVDLRTGEMVKEIDTGITEAFAGSLTGGAIDAERYNPLAAGNYQDDAVYAGYVKKSGTSWTDGGVGRIMIDTVTDPSDVSGIWHWSKVIDNIGPVTTAISKLQDRKNHNLWLYGGTGRYFYRDNVGLDDNSGARIIFGIKERCYNKNNIGDYLDKSCTDMIPGTLLEGGAGNLVNQTDTISALTSGDYGWRIKLDPSTASAGAERLVTDTLALTNGTVFFTSFVPTMDACGYGGSSHLWGVAYNGGGVIPDNARVGKVLIQLSTGEFKEIDIQTALTEKLNRRMGGGADPTQGNDLTGKPPGDAPQVITSSSNKPVKKILHIQEH